MAAKPSEGVRGTINSCSLPKGTAVDKLTSIKMAVDELDLQNTPAAEYQFVGDAHSLSQLR